MGLMANAEDIRRAAQIMPFVGDLVHERLDNREVSDKDLAPYWDAVKGDEALASNPVFGGCYGSRPEGELLRLFAHMSVEERLMAIELYEGKA